MNKVILMGNLTREPNIRYAQDGMAIAGFSIAVNRRFAKEKEKDADFFSCTAFGKTAEFVEKYLHQGSKILLTGRLQNDNYTNREGEKVFAVKVMVEELEFAGAKTGGSSGEKKTGQNSPEEVPESNEFMNIPEGAEEELPFV